MTGLTAAIDAAALRPDGRVDRAGNRIASLPLTPGGVRVAPNLILQSATANRPPTLIAPTSLLVNQGETRSFNFIASDPDAGQTVQVAASGASFASVAAAGAVYSLRLAPGASDGGPFTLTLTARDNQNAATSQTVALRVNRAPTSVAQTVSTTEATAKAITLAGSDPDGDALSFAIVTQPARGKLSAVSGANLAYIPPLNFAGADSFTFKASDGSLESAEATVAINVAAINDARRFAALSTGVSVLMPSAMDLASKIAPISDGVSVLLPSASDVAGKMAPLSAGVSILLPSASEAASKIAPLSAGVSVQFSAAANMGSVAPLSAGVSVQFASSAGSASQAAALSPGVSVQFQTSANSGTAAAPLSAGVSIQLPNASGATNIALLSAGVSVQAAPTNATVSVSRKSKGAPRSKPPP